MARHLESVICDRKTCSHLITSTQRHRVSLGGAKERLGRNEEYRIPSDVIEYLFTSCRPRYTHLTLDEESERSRRQSGVHGFPSFVKTHQDHCLVFILFPQHGGSEVPGWIALASQDSPIHLEGIPPTPSILHPTTILGMLVVQE